MVTTVQVQRLVRPFLKRHSDYVMVKRQVFKVPINRMVRGFYIKSSYRRERFMLLETYSPLVMAYTQPESGIVYERRSPRPRDAWNLAWPQEDMLLDDVLERIVWHRLEEASTFDAIIARDEREQDPSGIFAPRLMERFGVAARIHSVQGRFAEAEALCATFEEQFAKRMEAYRRVQEEMARQEPPKGRREKSVFRSRVYYLEPEMMTDDRINLEQLWPALKSGDKPRIAALLHGWEAVSMKNMKLEEHWRPTPFDWE